MFFDELNNDEWGRLSPLVADEPIRLNRRGRPRAETRVVVNAVLWILTTGNPWSKLPGRYPSGPTCRRRFEEWLVDGTLIEMVRVLSESGRTFVYIPEPPAPAAAPRPEPTADMDRLRGAFWKNPESWHTASVHANVCVPGGSIEAMTRQLSGSETKEAAREADTLQGLHARAEAWTVAQHAAPASPAAASPAAGGSTASAAARRDLPGGTSWQNFASPDAQVDHYKGYTIYASAQPVAKLMYRAWTEIVKDGKRIERSGLIGPRFVDSAEAQHYALDWGRDWVEGQSRSEAVDRVEPAAAADESAAHAAAAFPALPAPGSATTQPASKSGNVKRITPERRRALDSRSESKSSELLYQAG
ncbi:transposase [Trinickia terrae]|nr:transposase [Trinickia terrae]